VNHCYRLVCNAQGHPCVPAPESARGRGKAGGRSLKPLAVVLAAGFVASGAWAAPAADALPTGGQVVAGQAGISQSGNTLTVSQGSDKAIIDWQRFDIGSSAAVQFLQPSSSSVALNRVLSGDASQIYGSLTANGQVYLINPAGVVFGSGSKVDVGALVASTLDITNEDFLAGRLVFSRDGATGSVLNQGEITAAEGGLVALLAPTVKNEGVIRARLGTVALAAGDKVTLAAGADGLLQVALEPATVQTLIENKQLIVADGGQVLMTSKAADALSAGIVANSGTIQARTLQEQEGRILLLADMSHGEVRHSGLLDASAPDSGDGGFIETSAATVTLEAGRKVTTLAANGQTGTWLIDPNDYTIAASGGNITGAQLSADLALTSVSISTATQGTAGGNGDIFVNDTVSWNAATTLTLNAERNIEINAPITVAHAGGGLALNYGGSDYSLGAPVSFTAGSGGSFSVNGQAYTLIHSMAGLTAINATGLSGRYALATNLDASGTTYNSALIGNGSSSFTGTLAGLGHTISNLSISSVYNDIGLIGSLGQNGRVRDIGLVNVNISAGSYSGGLVGNADRARIDNVFVTGVVDGYYAGTIGGIVGYSYLTPITNAYFIGQVSGTNRVGGLVGANYGSISNSYAVAQVSGTGTGVGPLIGYGDPVSNSFYATTNAAGNAISISGQDNTQGTAKTYTELTQLSTFSGWDIDDAGASGRAWRIYDGNTLPLLRAFLTPVKVLVGDLGSKAYDGNGVSGTTNGYVVPNGVTLSGSGGTLSYWTGADAGTYSGDGGSLNITGGYYSSQTGYDIIYDGSYTITPKAITVSADAASKTYGDADPTLGWTADGLIGSDTLGGSLSRDAGENAGSYAIGQGTLGNANYSISFSGNTLTITPKAIMVTAGPASKTYGDADPVLSWTADGLIGNDTLNGSLSRLAGENVGSYAIALGTLSNANYSISFTFTGGALTITPKAITVSADAASKTYGDADPTLGWTADGLVGSDTLGGSLSRDAGENAGSYGIGQGTLSNANYVISFSGSTLTITPRAITVSADAASKTYGDADPALGWTTNGLLGSDTLSGSLSRDAGENAGSYAIGQGTLGNANYSISLIGNTLTITPASLTVTASDASKTYDGLSWSGGNGVSYSGFVNGENESVLGGTLSYGGNSQGAVDAGSYAIGASGLASGNYTISYVDGVLTVDKAALTIAASNAAKTYDGLAWSGGGGVSYSGFVNGEDASVLSGSLGYGGDAQGAVNAGSYGISLSGLSSGNYAITYQDGTLDVAKAVLTVTAGDASKAYDGMAWSGGNGVSYSGFVNGEDVSVLSGALSYGGSSQGAVAGGNYAITPGGLGSGNYLIQFVDGQLRIQRPLTMDGGRVSTSATPELTRRAPSLPGFAALMAGFGRTPVPLALASDFIQLAH